jgi:hypothetical protein
MEYKTCRSLLNILVIVKCVIYENIAVNISQVPFSHCRFAHMHLSSFSECFSFIQTFIFQV